MEDSVPAGLPHAFRSIKFSLKYDSNFSTRSSEWGEKEREENHIKNQGCLELSQMNRTLQDYSEEVQLAGPIS